MPNQHDTTNKQLTLFDAMPEDEPLPLLVAKKWGFSLATFTRDDNTTIYSVQDWIVGLSGASNNSAQKTWGKLNSELEIQSWETPYIAGNGRVYRMDMTTDKGLYRIAQEMRAMKKRPQLQEIKDYLAEAGAFVDYARRNPSEVGHKLASKGTQKYLAQGKSEDWIADRQQGIVSHNVMTAALQRAVTDGLRFDIFTNTEYRAMFQRTAKEISAATGHKVARDGMTRQALAFLSIAEATLTDMLKQRENLPFDDACDMMRTIARQLQPAMLNMQQLMQVDLATGKPLLGG